MPRKPSSKSLVRAIRAFILAVPLAATMAGAAHADTVVVRSGPKTSGSGSNWSEEFTITARAPAGHKIESHTIQLVGDRSSCGAWSTCRILVQTEDVLIMGVRLQGHGERQYGPFFLNNPNSGERDSEAILTIVTKPR